MARLRLPERSSPALLPAGLILGALTAMALVAVAPVPLVTDLAYLGGFAACTALAWVGVARHRSGSRGPWTWVAAGVTLTMVGDSVFEVLLDAPPGATVADLLWIPSYACLGIALLRLQPLRIARRGSDVDALIDSLAALVVGVLVAWEVALEDVVVSPGAPPLDRAVAGAYPVLDVALLALVVRLLLGGARAGPVARLATGTVVLLVADLAYAVDGGGAAHELISLFWMIALLLLTSSTLPSAADEPVGPAERTRMWLTLAPICVPIGLLLWGQVTHDHPNPALVLVCTLALLALAAVRSHRLLRAADDARAAVQAREHRFRALAANASDAVVVVDGTGTVTQGVESLAGLLEVEPAVFEGTPTADNELVVDPEGIEHLLARSSQAPGVALRHEAEVRHPDGSRRWMEALVTNLADDPVVGGIVVNVRDVTDRRRVEDELRHRAFHDPVTGVANRALLLDRLAHAMRRGGRRGADPALLHIDLDGFKGVNDRYGPRVGDQVLREVARRLSRAVRAEDTVARLADDEFAVLVEENHLATGEAATAAERIVQVLGAPADVEGHQLPVTASIGLAVGDGVAEPEDLLRRADLAMRHAKGSGGAQVVEYRDALTAAVDDLLVLRGELPRALAQGELELLYEPVVRLGDGAVLGAESHVSWLHPERGRLDHDTVRLVLDQTEVACEVGRWALGVACAAATRWGVDASGGPVIGVNLPGRHLASDRLVDDVACVLRTSGLAAPALVLEMPETAIASDVDGISRRLHALSAMGVRLGMDRFGTGHSSLAHLRQLPMDLVKIDQAFTRAMPDTEDVPPILRGLLDLAGRLGLDVVAEGLDRPAPRAALARAGCAAGQGPLLSPPVTADEMGHLLAERGDPARGAAAPRPAGAWRPGSPVRGITRGR